jgi:Glyoxalase-like domain
MLIRHRWERHVFTAVSLVLLVVGSAAHQLSDAWPDSARVAQAVELDHVYIWVQPGAPEAAILEREGFRVDPTATHHVGSGTSSRSVLFENAYLELLYLDSTVTDSALTAMEKTANHSRAQWRNNAAPAFGLGLRRRAGAADSLPFPTIRNHKPWMMPGTDIRATTTIDQLEAPDVFVVPAYMALPAWIESVRSDSRQSGLLQHPSRVRQLTHVRLSLVDPKGLVASVRALASAGVVEIDRGSAAVATLTFDGGRRGVVRDLRPSLPLVIRY